MKTFIKIVSQARRYADYLEAEMPPPVSQADLKEYLFSDVMFRLEIHLNPNSAPWRGSGAEVK